MSRKKSSGFTIVELLIVIVIIGILAAITIVAYNGTQQRARDSKRVNDITSIKGALLAYKSLNGVYPDSTSGQSGSWDSSADFRSGHIFLTNLVTSGIVRSVPIDPVNTSNDTDQNTGMHYNYYTYNDMAYLGTIGCATNRGKLAVLTVVTMESSSGTWPSSPGFSCTNRNFNNEAAWVWGDYDR